MAEKIQKDDLIETNNVGQRVVLVPAGQPVPDEAELDRRRRFANVISNASDEEVDAARGIKTTSGGKKARK